MLMLLAIEPPFLIAKQHSLCESESIYGNGGTTRKKSQWLIIRYLSEQGE